MIVDDRLATGTEAEQIVHEEKKDVKYRKIDSESGYLTDEVEIGNFKIYQRRDIVENLMLGDYNEKGDYVVNTNILKGLVGVRKEKNGDYNQIMFLNSVENFGEKGKLRFSLTISDVKEQEGYKIAVLKLLEPVKKIGGYIENTNSFIVASYKDKADEAFNARIDKVFHIVDPANDVGKDDVEVVNSIMQRLKFLNAYKVSYLQGVDTQEQAYYYARLEVLKDPKFEEILIEFKKHLTKASMFLDPTKSDYYAKLNELLDLSIDIATNKNKELGILANQALRPIVERHNQICEERHNLILENTKTAQAEQSQDAVVAQTQGGGAKKGGKGGSSKGGGKSAGGKGGSSKGGGKSGDKGGNPKETQFKKAEEIKIVKQLKESNEAKGFFETNEMGRSKHMASKEQVGFKESSGRNLYEDGGVEM